MPTTTRENLATLIASLRAITREPRWVRSDNLHVTLKFLGEVAEDELAAVETALGRIRSDQAVTLEFRGLGFFPNEKKPRVFWAGIAASSNLKTLAADIEGAMEKRSEEHTSELQSRLHLVCRLLLEKKKIK